MADYIHRVVNNFMVSNGGGWQSELKKIPKGYRLDRIIPLDVYTSCMIFVSPEADTEASDLESLDLKPILTHTKSANKSTNDKEETK